MANPARQSARDTPHPSRRATLAAAIKHDDRLPRVRELGRKLLASGLKAGSVYPEVWIRDTNTFIEASLEVNDSSAIREALRSFLLFQGVGGDIVDGYLPESANRTAAYRRSEEMPGVAAFKNTVESDQESSLLSAVRKYVTKTGDRAFLTETVNGRAVAVRLRMALEYVMAERWDTARGLVWSSATIDWGDIEPEDKLGDQIDSRSHPACCIYPNAMFAVAIADYLLLVGKTAGDYAHWSRVRETLRGNVRKHLWDARATKYRTHLYLNGSPFPASFDEEALYYFGGTGIAFEAGFLTRTEVRSSLAEMRRRVRAAGAGSIGLTVYPPYPRNAFLNPSVAEPYTYQNGGDWCWFGARIVQQLIAFGFVNEAYTEFSPMLDRVLKHNDFYEWWTRDNQPGGSAQFRGSAGVMLKAIAMFEDWANAAS